MEATERGSSPKNAPQGTPGWMALGGVALVVVTLVIGWFAFAAMYGIGVGNATSTPTGSTTTTNNAPVNVYLSIVNTPTGWDQYLPANFSVPSNTVIDFTITNFDNGVNNLTTAISTISGTSDGTESISGGAPGTPQGPVTSLPYGDTAHTFSIITGPQRLNVVMPPAAATNAPAVVTFSVTFNAPGTYTWICLAPCDPNSMQTPGFMSGTITVS